MLNIRPEGRNLNLSQAKVLDDEFFTSRPFQYFNSRISSLLDAEDGPAQANAKAAEKFFGVLNLSDTNRVLEFDERDRRLQVAADAFTLRHHVAEGLIRFLHALTVFAEPTGDARCIWRAIAAGPINLLDVVKQLAECMNTDQGLFAPLFLATGIDDSEASRGAVTNALAWTNHAIKLLTDEELTTNTAHNKFKHGLAVRGRDDLRLEFIPADAIPEGGGDISLTALKNSIPVFDRPLVTYLGRPNGKPKLGLEVTTLRIDVPSVLAEAWMMANVYGALFHVAAMEHFAGTDVEIAPYPTLPVGRLPDQLLNGQVLGLRQSVTTPPDGTTPARDTRLFRHGSSIRLEIDFNNQMSGTIVDD
ncbi:hypothetical protein [Lacisediminihabitans changchengi]|uniref:Uncharacterized protein n=1 Tax=Lacisediminihabitans changchengi TaxID=2787634 RepID=A0A934SJA8_9MICO|nr:hypothetical protein [Lacisediminihabitans changchengi]MBK4347676.1 hypothetical protein [Lacisediminihabitans changchengi]